MSQLAIFGGPKAITKPAGNLFTWPIITKEDEDAVLEVLRRGGMSGTDVTMKFEEDFKKWMGVDYALGFSSGTASLEAAMYGAGLRAGDEMIVPSVTYWASASQVMNLGATPVFANVDPETFCIDPKDIEHRIGPRTKAIMVVHYLSHPADMDPIMEIANKYNLKVIEDVSHAQGGLYKGRMVGTIGHVAGMSLMSGKSLACGEAGMLVTNDRSIYEHALVLGHYERFIADNIESPDLKPYAGIPMGGHKYRMHQLSSAVGRVQLKHYDERCAVIRKSMDYFWKLLEGVPGIRPFRVDESTGSNMAGYYIPHGLYNSKELGGLSLTRFVEAVMAEYPEVPEYSNVSAGANAALHTHNFFQTCDVYGHGKPTRIAFTDRDVRELDNDLEISEKIGTLTFSVPWFKHYEPEKIEEYANAFRKVCENYKELLADDPGDPEMIGGWHFFKHTKKKDK